MLAALALSFLAACSDDDDSDTITLDDCVAIDSSVLSGEWNCTILMYTVTLKFTSDNNTQSFTADVKASTYSEEGNTPTTITGTYALTNGGKSITVTTDNSEGASASTLLFYVLGYSESESKLTLYVKTASTEPFNYVLGQTLTFTKSSDTTTTNT